MDIIQTHSYPTRLRTRPTIRREKSFCDSFGIVREKQALFGLQEVLHNRTHVSQSMLGGAATDRQRSKFFVTEDSRQYLSQRNVFHQSFGKQYKDTRRFLDSVQTRDELSYSRGESFYVSLHKNFLSLHQQLHKGPKLRTWDVSPVRMWQTSMACAMVFGMVTMGMIYKNLGQSAQAQDTGAQDVLSKNAVAVVMTTREDDVDLKRLPVEDKIYSQAELQEIKERESARVAEELRLAAIAQKEAEQNKKLALKKIQEQKVVDTEKAEFEQKVREMVVGYPIEAMVDDLLKLDKEVAIYMIAMAKQESQWGKRKPVLNGEDCFNYWGFRKKAARMGSGGHTCFDDPQQAVEVVGKRVHNLFYEYKRTTPESMLVWKCGSSCDGHSPEGVQNWVNTVTMYRDALKS